MTQYASKCPKNLMDFAFIFRLNKDTTKGVSMALARTNFIQLFPLHFKVIIYKELKQICSMKHSDNLLHNYNILL